MYLQIVSPCGVDLGSTPLNDQLELCDGSYGLIDYVFSTNGVVNQDSEQAEKSLDFVAEIESGLLEGLRGNPVIGSSVVFCGFVGVLVS